MDELTRLARAARTGDAMALESFVRSSYNQVWRFCAALVDPAAADDLTQETYARCVRGLRKFRGDSSALTWVLSVARNVCASELGYRIRARKNTAVSLAEDLAEDPGGRTAPDVAEEVGVADLLGRLDQDRRAAFVLTQVLGLPYAEAAGVCGCPVGTIRSRVARAREDLVMMLTAGETVRQGRCQVGGTVSF